MSSTRERGFPLVDSMRAVAALSIFAFHSAFHLDGFTSAAGPYLAQLNVGVWIFFVISGFLLYRPFARARLCGTPAPAIRVYALRRIARIVPAYWVALVAIASWIGLDYVFTPSGIVTYFGFLQLYSAHTFVRGIGQAWTLCIEITFYAALPLLALAMRRLPVTSRTSFLRSELGFCAALAMIALGWQVIVIHLNPATPAGTYPVLLSLPGWLDLFGMGMALAVLSIHAEDRSLPRALRLPARSPWICWAVAGGLYYLSVHPDVLGSHPAVRITGVHELKGLVALAVMYPAVIGREHGGHVRRVLGSPLLRWVGLVSYGLYLWHLVIIEELAKHGLRGAAGAGGLVAGSLALALAAAAASFYLIERPAIRLSHGRRR